VSAALPPLCATASSALAARTRRCNLGAEQVTNRPSSLPVPAQNSNYLENGRWYHGFRRGIYMYPCDEVSGRRASASHRTR
jgi:hypothetical protein